MLPDIAELKGGYKLAQELQGINASVLCFEEIAYFQRKIGYFDS